MKTNLQISQHGQVMNGYCIIPSTEEREAGTERTLYVSKRTSFMSQGLKKWAHDLLEVIENKVSWQTRRNTTDGFPKVPSLLEPHMWLWFLHQCQNGLCSLEEAGCGFCQLEHILNMLKSHLYIELSMLFWCCMLCVFATALLYLGDRCSWSSNIKSCIYSAKFLQMLTFGKWHSFLVVEK